ncbi:hypothetical protein B0H21DRAFT_807221 [Amylocystis lapponica]|nr:hypothetical protein B0H21DRAFT_807221 [Amylocystis lapponica]
MTILALVDSRSIGEDLSSTYLGEHPIVVNPVLVTAQYALEDTDMVGFNENGIQAAAKYIHERLQIESYTPCTWRKHPLHLCPSEPYSLKNTSTRACLDWIFFISSINFSFWSEQECSQDRYGVEWRTGWHAPHTKVHTGYWALVAAVNKALDEGIPLTDPAFYSSETRCSHELFRRIFRPAPQSKEQLPLLEERIVALREVGQILCKNFEGSFQGFYEEFLRRYDGRGTALDLVQMITNVFPSFRDETIYKGRKVYLWKRAQICVAEAWAAFHPPADSPHPLFPDGAAIHQLTMFADYRVPQILHHLRILTYPPSLVTQLKSHFILRTGSREELSIRAASIVAVERVRKRIRQLCDSSIQDHAVTLDSDSISSVLIDFYLWDLAKRIEVGEDCVEGIETTEILPAHRTRCVWY